VDPPQRGRGSSLSSINAYDDYDVLIMPLPLCGERRIEALLSAQKVLRYVHPTTGKGAYFKNRVLW